MTNDYKELLLKYLTNNITEGTGQNIPSFSAVKSEAQSIYDELTTAFPYGWVQNGYVLCKNSNNEYNGFIVVYGAYYIDNTQNYETAKGYILLLDESFNLVQIITEYNTGTDFGIFMKLIVDEDGLIYGLDYYSSKNRFIMLNNISVKAQSANEYSVKLRQSYFLQGNVENMSHTGKSKEYILQKDPNSANYIIGMQSTSSGYIALTQFQINVGSSNVWLDYTLDVNMPDQSLGINVFGTYVVWEDNDPQINSYLSTYVYDSGAYINYLYRAYNNYGSQSLNIQESQFMTYSPSPFTYSMAAIISPTNIYYIFEGQDEISGGQKTRCSLSIVHSYKTNQQWMIIKAYEDYFEQINNGQDPSAYFDTELYNLNGTIGCIYSTIIEKSSTHNQMKTVGVIVTSDDNSVSVNLGNPYYSSYNQYHILVIANQYNLFNYYSYFEEYGGDWNLNSSYTIYNSNNYNGIEYEEKRSLLPTQSLLYNEDGDVIFARNLYNKVVINNVTEATVEVPNTMLNNINIAQQDLLGYTNYHLVSNNDTINKNIYETLYINFFNTLLIQDRNNPTYINNLTASNRLNNSISNLVDYESATMGKYRINYHDGTSVVYNIAQCDIVNNVATVVLSIYVGKEIDSIDLISNDEQTIYLTIEQELTVGNFYEITQDCYIQ